MPRLLIHGPAQLHGHVTVSGSKNATLPILAATLLIRDRVTLTNVPRIIDVERFLSLLSEFGCVVDRDGQTVTVDATNAQLIEPSASTVKYIRASILLLGPVLARFKEVTMAYPGGCVIGRRPIGAHEQALVELGAEIVSDKNRIWMRTGGLRGKAPLVLPQLSVTATENAIMGAVTAPGRTEIRLAAAEPHVADLCTFLVACGAKISGIGSHNITIEGVEALHGCTHRVRPDYIEAGTWALAGVLTGSPIEIHDVISEDNDALWARLRSVGAAFEFDGGSLRITPPFELKAFPGPWADTRTFPGFPTDLQAPFAVLLTQLPGVTKLFETFFEGRLAYLFELEKLGAHVEVMNPHQALILGPRKLRGGPVASMDLRAGFAMVLAGLIAEEQTEISNIDYIDRGYEDLDGKLRGLGVVVERIEDTASTP